MIRIEEKKLTSSRKFNRKFCKYINANFENNNYLKDNKEDLTSPFLVIEKNELKQIIEQYCNENNDLNEKLVKELRANVEITTELDAVVEEVVVVKEEVEEVEVDYYIYKNYFYSLTKVPNSYNNKKISLYVNKEQKEKILAKLKELEEYKNKFIETIVLYKDYKKLFEGKGYRTKNYNSKEGTIVVYLPKEVTYKRKTKDRHYEDRFAFKQGLIDELTITPTTINADDLEVEIPECLMN